MTAARRRPAYAILALAVAATAWWRPAAAGATPEDVAIAIDDVTAAEGAEATFTVTMTHVAPRVSFDFATVAATATDGADYAAAAGRVEFDGNATTAVIRVVVAPDALDEDDETFRVEISNVENATATDSTGIATIADDDDPPALGIADVEAVEDAGELRATVTLDAPSGRTVTVGYATADGTAQGTTDYTPATGTLTFAPGETTADVVVPLTADSTDEPDETVAIELANPAGATIARARATATIQNDDPAPAIAPSDATVAEGAAEATVTVALSAPSGRTVSVDYATVDGTATAGGGNPDYSAATGTLTFAPGETAKGVTIPVTQDALDEDDETLTLALSHAQDALLADAEATLTITDDDDAPAVSAAPASAPEGAGALVFEVTLGAPSGKAVTVAYETAGRSATAGADYAETGGTLTFAPGDTTKQISVPILDDAIGEADEILALLLTAAENATIATPEAIGSIADDEPLSSLAVGDAAAPELKPAVTKTEDFEDDGLTFPTTGTWARSTTAAQAGAWSYRAATIGHGERSDATFEMDFPAGSTDRKLSFYYKASSEVSRDWFYYSVNGFQWGGCSGACPWTKVEHTSSLHDGLNTLTVSYVKDATGSGGSDTAWVDTVVQTYKVPGPSTAVFTVTLLPATERTVSVEYATADGTATAPADYAHAQGNLTFAPGETEKQVPVVIAEDPTDEFDETYTLALSTPDGATLADAEGAGTILDDDAPPVVFGNWRFVGEGDEGPTDVGTLLSISRPSGKPISVNFASANSGARSGEDYVAKSGTATFQPGTTNYTITTQVLGDLLDEATEDFVYNLSSPINVTISGSGGGRVSITDNDDPPSVSIADATGTEASKKARFVVTLTAPSGRQTWVNYRSEAGTASSPGDYAFQFATLFFDPGVTSRTIDVALVDDALDEFDETFTMRLTSATNLTIADATATGTITDDDEPPSITIENATTKEGSSPARHTVRLSAKTSFTVTADFATEEATATAGADYTPQSGTLTFAPGETVKEIAVDIADDTAPEEEETYLVRLSSVRDAFPADSEATGTITDDEPRLVVDDTAAFETTNSFHGPTGTLVFTLRLTDRPDGPVNVDFTTVDGTATSGVDYVPSSGRTVFGAGEQVKEVTVLVNGDTFAEPDETVLMRALAADVPITDAEGVGTILDDDSPDAPRIVVSDAFAEEGAGVATFTVSISRAPTQAPVTVVFNTEDGSATATVGPDGDYFPTAQEITFFPGGSTEWQTNVPIRDDELCEDPEFFLGRLSGAAGATIERDTGTAWIVDDDCGF